MLRAEDMAPLTFNAGGYDTEQGLRAAAGRLVESAGRATTAVVAWQAFNSLLNYHRPASGGAHSAFPGPGLFVQTHAGWMLVTPDLRLAPGTAIIRDAFTGQAVEVSNLPEN